MDLLMIVGIGVWMIGSGVAKLPGGNIIGAVAQIVGGSLFLISALV